MSTRNAARARTARNAQNARNTASVQRAWNARKARNAWSTRSAWRVAGDLSVSKLLGATVLALCLGACASVQPWERGTLARPEMQLDPNPLQTGLYEQVYDSKEAASGGGDTAGAGCGCN